MALSRYDARSRHLERTKVMSPQTISDLLEEFEMATLWVRSQHDVAKEKIFSFLQKWNDKGRKYIFQILESLLDHFFNHHYSLHPRGERKTKPAYLKTFLPRAYSSGPVTLLAAYFWSLPSDKILPAFSFFGHLRPFGKPLPKIAVVYDPWADRRSVPYGTKTFLCPAIPACPPLDSPVFDKADLVFDNPTLREATEEDAGQPEKLRPTWEYETDYAKEASEVLSWVDKHGKESWTKRKEDEIGLLRRYVEGLEDVHTHFPDEWAVDGHVPMQLFPRLVHNIRVLYDDEENNKEGSSKAPTTQCTEQNDCEGGSMDVQGISFAESFDTGLEMRHKSPSLVSGASHMAREGIPPVTFSTRHSTAPEDELVRDSIAAQLPNQATLSASEDTTREEIAVMAGQKRKRAATKDQETPHKYVCNGVDRAAQRDRAMVEDLAEKLENFVTWGQNLLRAAHNYLYA